MENGGVETVNQNADPEFVALVHRSLAIWIDTFKNLDEFDWFEIDRDRANIFQQLSFGIAHTSTFETAVSLCVILFEYIERRGYWQEWYSLFELAYAQFDQADYSPLKLQLLNCLVQLNILMDRTEEADYYLTSLSVSLEALPPSIQGGSLLCSLAQVAVRKGEYDEAKAKSKMALKIYNEIDYQSGMAHVKVILGMIYQQTNQRDKAIEHYENALIQWQSLENDFWIARTMINLAYCLIEIDQFDAADGYFDQALKILAKSNYEFDKATAHINRGLLYYRLEKWTKAEDEFNLANSRFLRESPHTYLKSLIFHNLGSVQIKKGDYSIAEENLNFAVELRRQLDDDLRLASSLGTSGELLQLNGKQDDSKAALDEALGLLEKYPDNAWALDMKEKFLGLRESLSSSN